jgi:hypothetical protein
MKGDFIQQEVRTHAQTNEIAKSIMYEQINHEAFILYR